MIPQYYCDITNNSLYYTKEFVIVLTNFFIIKVRSAQMPTLLYRELTVIGKVADTVGSVADSVGQLSNQLGRMTLNKQSRKPFYCSNCEQEGHKKNSCPKLNPVAKSNFTRYYSQLPSTQSQYTPPASD